MRRRLHAMFVTPRHQDWPHVINLVNSIIGVSLLVMPFCFQKCGVFLGILLLAFSTWLTYVSCYLLVKAASVAKTKSYEYLAFQTLGRIGKLSVEISIVGVQLGVAVAIFVVIGDLAAELLCKAAGLPHATSALRAVIMVALAFGVTLPLSLQRDLSNLHLTNLASTVFYLAIVTGIMMSALPALNPSEWFGHVSYWKMDYAFECLPIFALSYACQTQMFVIFESMNDATLPRMKHVTITGISLCFLAYTLVGVFGYIAFWYHDINGNVLLSLAPSSPLTIALKLGFVLSMVLSFPLIVFPCRDSLNSLCCHAASNCHGNQGHGMPFPMSPARLRGFTIFIILFTLIVAVIFPNVEFILALTGATMGTTVGFIFPPLLYLKAADSKLGQQDSRRAKAVLICGVMTLCISTHQTLFNMSSQSTADISENIVIGQDIPSLSKESVVNEHHDHWEHHVQAEGEPPDAPDDKEKYHEPVAAALRPALHKDIATGDESNLSNVKVDRNEAQSKGAAVKMLLLKDGDSQAGGHIASSDTHGVYKKDIADSSHGDKAALAEVGPFLIPEPLAHHPFAARPAEHVSVTDLLSSSSVGSSGRSPAADEGHRPSTAESNEHSGSRREHSSPVLERTDIAAVQQPADGNTSYDLAP